MPVDTEIGIHPKSWSPDVKKEMCMKVRIVLLLATTLALTTMTLAQSPKKSAPAEKSGLGQFSWLLGNWEATRSVKKAVEKWTRDSAGVYKGISMAVLDKDTIVLQHTTIAAEGDKIVLSAEFVSRKQNSKFHFEHLDTTGYVFQNADPKTYPQTITYLPIGADSLSVWVQGPSGGGAFQRQGYVFRRTR